MLYVYFQLKDFPDMSMFYLSFQQKNPCPGVFVCFIPLTGKRFSFCHYLIISVSYVCIWITFQLIYTYHRKIFYTAMKTIFVPRSLSIHSYTLNNLFLDLYPSIPISLFIYSYIFIHSFLYLYSSIPRSLFIYS